MTEPQTTGKGLIIPLTGDLPGTWGSDAINPDMTAIDGMLAGFVTVSLTNTNVTLTAPSGFTATPGAGPVQSQNAMVTLSGTLTGNVTVTFPLPGYYIVNNICVTGAYYVKLASSSPGNVVCAPPGEAVHVFCDGTDMYYVNLGRVGSYLDLATTAVPAWITNCTVPPYLNCDGTSFSSGTYPALASYLGGTTLPDLRGRARAALNQGTNRLTTSGSGVDGDVILSAGGAETHTLTAAQLASHVHNNTVSVTSGYVASTTQTVDGGSQYSVLWQILSNVASITNVSAGGDSPHNNVQPTTVAGLTLIRAA